MAVVTAEVRRPLSPVERWYWIADQLSPLNVVARVRLDGELPAGLLDRAAVMLAGEYPLLRVAIAADQDGTNPRFVPAADRIAVETLETDWESHVEGHELAVSVDWATGPLVRIVDVVSGPPVSGSADSGSIRRTHDVILTASHVIADGTTALTLLRKLVEHAERLRQELVEPVPSRPAVAAPEDLLPRRHRGVRGIAGIAATSIADQAVTAVARPRRLRAEVQIPVTERRTRLIRRTLTGPQLDAVAAQARAAQVTMHGALAAAMVLAVGPAAAQRESGRICIGSPVDFRRELAPAVAADEVGAYVSTVPSVVRFGGSRDIWTIARQVNRSLRRRRRAGQHLALLNALRFVCPASLSTSSRVVGLIERNGPGNVCLSNIGRFDFPAQVGDWQLSGAQFIAGVSVSGYFVATVNASHDELAWNFTFIDGIVSPGSAEMLADAAVAALLAAVGEEATV